MMIDYKHLVETKKIQEIVLDTGVLVNYFTEQKTSSSDWLERYLFAEDAEIMIFISEIQRAELYYILCRHLGEPQTKKIFAEIITVAFTFIIDDEISYNAGKIKWKQSISLADCFCIATAMYLDCPCVFLQEKELPSEKIKAISKQFKAKIIQFEK
jgi:predicted nucleic acid-binding protein